MYYVLVIYPVTNSKQAKCKHQSYGEFSYSMDPQYGTVCHLICLSLNTSGQRLKTSVGQVMITSSGAVMILL